MKPLILMLCIAAFALNVLSHASPQKPQVPPHPNAPATQEIQTEQIEAPRQTPPVVSNKVNAPGHMEPEQVKALAHQIWLVQFRLNDLLTQVQTEKWHLSPALLQSFNQSMDSLHKALQAQEGWRSQLEARPDSLYLGFMTYVSISAVLPRVDGLARSVVKYENGSLGAQYSQAANQLFDLQQKLEPHLAALLRSQDNVILVAQTNLASCQNELNFAEHDKEGRATPMRNIAPVFKGHGRAARTPAASGTAKPAETKDAAAGKPATNTRKKAQNK